MNELQNKSIFNDLARLGPEDGLNFRCGGDLECFTRCCSDVSIVLTPYDVLRMKNAVHLNSSEFLDQHTLPVLSEKGVPILFLRMEGEEKRCTMLRPPEAVGDVGPGLSPAADAVKGGPTGAGQVMPGPTSEAGLKPGPTGAVAAVSDRRPDDGGQNGDQNGGQRPPLQSGQSPTHRPGCGIYAHRPWACRMYPLGVARPENPRPDEPGFFFLIREDLCQGHGKGNGSTVRAWTSSQEIEAYEMMSESFERLMADLGRSDKLPDSGLTPKQTDMILMACYDLDRFRRFVFESSFLERFDVDENRVEAMQSDDLDLLDFGVSWLRFCLLGERTLRVKNPPIAVKA